MVGILVKLSEKERGGNSMRKKLTLLLTVALSVGTFTGAYALYDYLSDNVRQSKTVVERQDTSQRFVTQPTTDTPLTVPSVPTTDSSTQTTVTSKPLTSPGTAIKWTEANTQQVIADTLGPTESNTATDKQPNTNAVTAPQTTTESQSTQTSQQTQSTAEPAPQPQQSQPIPETTPVQQTTAQVSQPVQQPVQQSTQPIAQDFTVTDLKGNPVKLSDFKGKPVILNFWASWCPNCVEEMSIFDTAAKNNPNVVFLMVDAVDGQRETVDKGKSFISSKGYTFPVYFDTSLEATTAYSITALPQTYFIDKDGHILGHTMGKTDAQVLQDNLVGLK